MAQYHGDLSQFDNSFYASRSEKSAAIAIGLLFFVGFTGAHRFYLDDLRLGMAHLLACFVAIMFGIFTLNFALAFWIFFVQGLVLTGELVWFVFKVANDSW